MKELAEFLIPRDAENGTPTRVSARVMPDRNDNLHGFIVVGGECIEPEMVAVVIAAMKSALVALEDNCHNHPTQPMLNS